MKNLNNQNWIYTIEDLIDKTCQSATPQQVKDIFKRYGVKGLDDLDSSKYEVVYMDLKDLVCNS